VTRYSGATSGGVSFMAQRVSGSDVNPIVTDATACDGSARSSRLVWSSNATFGAPAESLVKYSTPSFPWITRLALCASLQVGRRPSPAPLRRCVTVFHTCLRSPKDARGGPFSLGERDAYRFDGSEIRRSHLLASCTETKHGAPGGRPRNNTCRSFATALGRC